MKKLRHLRNFQHIDHLILTQLLMHSPLSQGYYVFLQSYKFYQFHKEFQKNVQLVQQQRALAAEVLSKLEASESKDEKVQLKAQFDSLQKKLNENNQLMFKTYGFSLNRNYVLTVEKSHIHMWVTAEEAEVFSKQTSGMKSKTVKPKEESGFRSLFKKKK